MGGITIYKMITRMCGGGMFLSKKTTNPSNTTGIQHMKEVVKLLPQELFMLFNQRNKCLYKII